MSRKLGETIRAGASCTLKVSWDTYAQASPQQRAAIEQLLDIPSEELSPEPTMRLRIVSLQRLQDQEVITGDSEFQRELIQNELPSHPPEHILLAGH